MRLIRNWQLWWRRWSTWFAAVNAALWSSLTAQSGMMLGFLPFIPYQYAAYGAAFVFVLMFVVPVFLRHLAQPDMDALRQAENMGSE